MADLNPNFKKVSYEQYNHFLAAIKEHAVRDIRVGTCIRELIYVKHEGPGRKLAADAAYWPKEEMYHIDATLLA